MSFRPTNFAARPCILGVTAAAASFLLTLSIIPASSAKAESVLDLPFLADCGICDTCDTDEGGRGHVAMRHSEGERQVAEDETGCEAGTCHETHPLYEICDGEGGEEPIGAVLPELWFAFRNAEGAELAALVSEHSDRIDFNSDRGAIQFIGCNDVVVAHLPLSDEQRLVLAD